MFAVTFTLIGCASESIASDAVRYCLKSWISAGTCFLSSYRTRKLRTKTRCVCLETLMTVCVRNSPFGTVTGLVSFATRTVLYHPIDRTLYSAMEGSEEPRNCPLC